jgi:hypothetical protein
MGIVRSTANPLAATFLLSTALIANCTAQAQTIGNAGGSKRILVLHIVEVGSAKATSIKKHRWAIAAAKKKVVGRNLVGRTVSAAVDATLMQPPSTDLIAENALAVHENVTPLQSRIAVSSSEPIDTLSFDDRAVTFSSFSSERDISAAANETVAATANRDVDDAIVKNATSIADRETQQSPVRSPTISPVMASVSGALLACGFGWFLVRSSGRREARQNI